MGKGAASATGEISEGEWARTRKGRTGDEGMKGILDVAIAAWIAPWPPFATASPPRISGLPARLAGTLPFLFAPLAKLSLSFLRVPSLISPPEPATSFSLPEPA